MKRGEPPKWSYCKEGGTFAGCLLPSNASIATNRPLTLSPLPYQSSRRILKHPCCRGKRGAQLLSMWSTSGVRLRGEIELREVQGRGQLMRITLASKSSRGASRFTPSDVFTRRHRRSGGATFLRAWATRATSLKRIKDMPVSEIPVLGSSARAPR